jgi:hypothetical protein
MYPSVLTRLYVSLNFVQCPVSMICPATTDLSGCPRQRCSLRLISVLFLVCPIYALLQLHGIQ